MIATFVSSILLSALVAVAPSAWEQNVDLPTLQVNFAANAVRGMRSGATCMNARSILRRFGGDAQRNQCALAIESPAGTGYFAYCDRETSYIVQMDLATCSMSELEEFRSQRLTGTAIIDEQHGRVLFSHMTGMHAYRAGRAEPLRSFSGSALYSQREFYTDGQHAYLLNTLHIEPILHRIDLKTLRETRVRLGQVTVLGYRSGKLLLRSQNTPGLHGIYDVRRRGVVQRWRHPEGMQATMVGSDWVAFSRVPDAERAGDFILAHIVTGHSVYHAYWQGDRVPTVRWREGTLFAGTRALLKADAVKPIPTMVRPLHRREGAG